MGGQKCQDGAPSLCRAPPLSLVPRSPPAMPCAVRPPSFRSPYLIRPLFAVQLARGRCSLHMRLIACSPPVFWWELPLRPPLCVVPPTSVNNCASYDSLFLGMNGASIRGLHHLAPVPLSTQAAKCLGTCRAQRRPLPTGLFVCVRPFISMVRIIYFHSCTLYFSILNSTVYPCLFGSSRVTRLLL